MLLSKHLTQQTNGVTISRYCASSLESIRLAANAVKAGEGDVYVAAGVEFVSRYNGQVEAAHPEDQNPRLQGKHDGEPDAYIAMGLTAENVAAKYGVSREDQDAYAKRSQDRAVAASGGRHVRPRDRPRHAARRHRREQGRRPAPRHDDGEARHAQPGLQGGRHA